MISVFDKDVECCGCEACRQICPKQCISFCEDPKGFYYPRINQTECIDCGLCRSVCLYHADIIKSATPQCYVYLNNDEQYRLNSSSSGAFEAICRSFAHGAKDSDIIIFGCELRSDLIAHHTFSIGFSDFDKFRKSKYIQSRIGDTFKDVRKFLKEGKRVIFSGTPCQIMGLKSFLKKDYENLLLVDIVCHGVPSQKVFSQYLKYLEIKNHSRVIDYKFRFKCINSDGNWSNLNTKVHFANGQTKTYNCDEDIYMAFFLRGMFNREACEECHFATVERVSDLTMGDFWGIDKTIPSLSELITNGTSLILINSDKGKEIVAGLSSGAILKEMPLSSALPYNGQLSHPQKLNGKSNLFFKYVNKKNGFLKAMRACYPEQFGLKATLLLKVYSSRFYQYLSLIKKRLSI